MKLTPQKCRQKILTLKKTHVYYRSLEGMSIGKISNLKQKLTFLKEALHQLQQVTTAVASEQTKSAAVIFFNHRRFVGDLAHDFSKYVYTQLGRMKFDLVLFIGQNGARIFKSLFFNATIIETNFAHVISLSSKYKIYVFTPYYNTILSCSYQHHFLPSRWRSNLNFVDRNLSELMTSLLLDYYQVHANLVEEAKRYLSAKGASKNIDEICTDLQKRRYEAAQQIMNKDLIENY